MDKNNHHHIKENFEKWLGVWDQACKEGIFDNQKSETEAETELGIDSDYAARLSGIEIGLIQEEKTPNPVYPDSIGKDQDNPKSVWVDEDLLKEIEGLKQKLFDLENKFAKMDDSSEGATIEKIKSIQKQIDDVSSSLGIKDEPSPWEYEKK